MKALGDLLAVILFFATYSISKDIVLATIVAIVVGIVQAAWTFYKHRKLETMQWISLILIVVFGGATVLFGDAQFIMWKPTLLFWAGAAAILISRIMGKQPLQALMGKEIQVPSAVWSKLSYMWAAFLVLLGIINVIVFKTMSEAAWVNYKMFGSTALMFIFIVAQTIYLRPYLSSKE
ncbi:MAG: septation protein A [Neisseria sp.]|nr:septation protein A [Neisseria sp.]